MSNARRSRQFVALFAALLAIALSTESVEARRPASRKSGGRARKADPTHLHALARRLLPTRRPKRASFSRAEAARFFDQLAGARLAFDFPDFGCEDRAHVAAALAERAGVVAHKVLVYSDGEVPLRAETPNTLEGSITWGEYHIALALRVDGALRVFDPAVFDRPVSVRTWKQRIGAQGARVKVLAGNQYMDDYDPAPREVRIRQLAGSLHEVAQLRRKARARQAELQQARSGE